ncbi:Basic-leucine zipper domain [Sesbania bispinosa]|nr:Basic-leucine zipper domain [Sesbania bispinosa]
MAMASSRSRNEDLRGECSLSADEVWKEIVAGSTDQQNMTVTLEDFLTKPPAVTDQDTMLLLPPQTQTQSNEKNGIVAVGGIRGGKRRAVAVEESLDKATLQKQRRMIKNRASAARSRERKQAYTLELESLVVQLEEENARLQREEAEKKKQRFNQLMKCLIPVVEKRKPDECLRRVNSVHW